MTFFLPWIYISEFLHFSWNCSFFVILYMQSSRKVLNTRSCYAFAWNSLDYDIKRPGTEFPPGLETPPPLFSEGTPPLSGYPPFSEAIFKNYLPFSESHSNWCMEIVLKTLKWRSYISYYIKSIENIIITLYTFRLNSVFATDSLVRYYL